MASEAATVRPSSLTTATLTLLSLVAFAGNSLLTRLALTQTSISWATFAWVRIVAGAIALMVIVLLRRGPRRFGGSWPSAVALCVYAVAFSLAYVGLPAGTGALLLFGAVQATMITTGVVRGERLSVLQSGGLLCAYAGLVALVLPGVSAPPLRSALLMVIAGAAWGVYSLRGKGGGDPIAATAGNFLRATPITLLVCVWWSVPCGLTDAGMLYAIASGALTSGIGYAIWYTALRGLRATDAATVQLSVPVIAAAGGVVLLAEPLTTRLIASAAAILGGVALVVLAPKPSQVGE